MKKFFLFLALSLSLASIAQVTKVSIQASGLTCSMCSNAINKRLRTLDFVEKIEADIKQYTFEIYCKKQSNVDFYQIRKKVEDAGFSVSRFEAVIQIKDVRLQSNQTLPVGKQQLLFVNAKEQSLNGEIKVRVLDKGFVSSKEYKASEVANAAVNPGIFHVSL